MLYATGFETIFILNLLLSIVAGYLIGSERKHRGKPAGVSTYTLVVAGSMLFTLLSANVDPYSKSRIAAQIITGIGFIGAGLIIQMKESGRIANLTTAASIWFAAAVGMAFGYGYHILGIIGAIACVTINRLPNVSEILGAIKRK